MLRDGLHDALLGGLLVLINQLINSFQVGDADLALFRVGLGFGRLAGGEQCQAQQRPSEQGHAAASLIDASVWATLGCTLSRRSVSQHEKVRARVCLQRQRFCTPLSVDRQKTRVDNNS